MDKSRIPISSNEPQSNSIPVRSPLLQRKCACGNSVGSMSECNACQTQSLTLQRQQVQSSQLDVPPIVHEVIRSSGQTLDPQTQHLMESRFHHDFSQVRLHTDEKASESARSVNALAYTVGQQIVFDSGHFNPRTLTGQTLLAHELVHTIQQGKQSPATTHLRLEDAQAGAEQEADAVAQQVVQGSPVGSPVDSPVGLPQPQARISQTLQRQRRRSRSTTVSAPRVGTRFTHAAGSRSPYRRITGEFDGREFVLKGDGTELMRVEAASGRPVAVRPADIRACGGASGETYKNNPRYVGIADYGPIPEGQYQFQATQLATFTSTEQAQFTFGGQFTDPFGAPMHGGDWGAGRVPLQKIRVSPASRGCGNTSRRSGFYLHGGSLAGSSGCIDVGNAGIAAILPHLEGYRRQIVVSVRYAHPAPSVGLLERVMGGATYPGQHDPSVLDRLEGAARELFGGTSEEDR